MKQFLLITSAILCVIITQTAALDDSFLTLAQRLQNEDLARIRSDHVDFELNFERFSKIVAEHFEPLVELRDSASASAASHFSLQATSFTTNGVSAACNSSLVAYLDANAQSTFAGCISTYKALFNSDATTTNTVLNSFCDSGTTTSCINVINGLFNVINSSCTVQDLTRLKIGVSGQAINYLQLRLTKEAICLKDGNNNCFPSFATLINLATMWSLSSNRQGNTTAQITAQLTTVCTPCLDKVLSAFNRLLPRTESFNFNQLAVYCLKDGATFCLPTIYQITNLTKSSSSSTSQIFDIACANQCYSRFTRALQTSFGDIYGGSTSSSSSFVDFSAFCEKNSNNEYCVLKVLDVIQATFKNTTGGCPFNSSTSTSTPSTSSIVISQTQACIRVNMTANFRCNFFYPADSDKCPFTCSADSPCICPAGSNCPASLQSIQTAAGYSAFTCPGSDCILPSYFDCCSGSACQASGISGAGSIGLASGGTPLDSVLPSISSGTTCEPACRTSMNTFISNAGCCAASYVRLLGSSAGVAYTDLSVVKFISTQCGIGLPTPCQDQGKISGILKIRNFRFSYYQSAARDVELGLKSDLATIAGVSPNFVNISSVTSLSSQSRSSFLLAGLFLQADPSTLAGISVNFVIVTPTKDLNTQVTQALTAGLNASTTALTSLAYLPLDARVQVDAPFGVDPSSANTVQTSTIPKSAAMSLTVSWMNLINVMIVCVVALWVRF